MLFHPSDIGIQEMGLAETVLHSIGCTPEGKHAHTYIYIYIHTHTHIHTHKYTDLQMCVCMHLSITSNYIKIDSY